MFKKILLGYDGSEPGNKAFEQCLEMARCFGAQLSIVTVVRPPEFAEDVETEAIIENARSHYDSELGKLRAREHLGHTTSDAHPGWPSGRANHRGRRGMECRPDRHRPPWEGIVRTLVARLGVPSRYRLCALRRAGHTVTRQSIRTNPDSRATFANSSKRRRMRRSPS